MMNKNSKHEKYSYHYEFDSAEVAEKVEVALVCMIRLFNVMIHHNEANIDCVLHDGNQITVYSDTEAGNMLKDFMNEILDVMREVMD